MRLVWAIAASVLVVLMVVWVQRDPGFGPEEVSEVVGDVVDEVPLDGVSDAEDRLALERAIVDRTNLYRAEFDLPPLKVSPRLSLMARRHSENMARVGVLSHAINDSLSLRAVRADYPLSCHVSENIAYRNNSFFLDVEGKARALTQQWYLSMSHRRNMLDSSHLAIGVGVAVADGRVYVTQNFGRCV